MNEWKVTFLVRGTQTIAVNVKSNNEFYARENAKRKLLTQYSYLHLQPEEYEITSCRMTKNNNIMIIR